MGSVHIQPLKPHCTLYDWQVGHWESALTARKLDTCVLGVSLTGLEYGLLRANIQTGGSLATHLYNPTLIVGLGETHPATTL